MRQEARRRLEDGKPDVNVWIRHLSYLLKSVKLSVVVIFPVFPLTNYDGCIFKIDHLPNTPGMVATSNKNIMVPQHTYTSLLSNIKHHAGQPWADPLHWCPSGPLRVTSNMEPQH